MSGAGGLFKIFKKGECTMRVVCEKNDLVSGLTLALRAMPSRNILPILEGVLFDAEEDLYLWATDLETGLKVKVSAQVDEPGKIVLPGKIIGEMARSLPSAAVTLETNGENNQASVNCSDLNLNIVTYEADQFPPIDMTLDDAVSYDLKTDFLRQITKYVAVAVAKEDVRGPFSGILWEDDGNGQVTIVGTDSYRMAWMETTIEREPGPEVRAVIPANAVLNAARVEANGDASVCLRLTKSQASFGFPDVLIVSRLLDAKYPNFHAVIPASFETKISCSADELIDAVERAGLLAREEENKNRANLVTLSISKNNIGVSSQASQLGTLSDVVPAQIEGKEDTIIFNARYLLDGLKMHAGCEITVKIAANSDAVIIESADHPGVHYLTLPVRFS